MAYSEYRKGEHVEISNNDPDFRGSWYLGTVYNEPRGKDKSKVFVEYKTLMREDNVKIPLREKLDVSQLRPPPPPEDRRSFSFGEEVDAYYNDGWWEGVITKVSGDIYTVYFRGTREEIDFGLSELRLHREWVNGRWKEELGPFTNVEDSSKIISGFNKDTMVGVTNGNTNLRGNHSKGVVDTFGKGTLIEVTSDEDGFQGAWFAATILQKVSDDEYMIEYQSLTNDEGTELLKEKANIKYIRPYPPKTAEVDYFRLLQEVDALYNDGWWVGVISKVLRDKRYIIYFSGTKEEMEFKQSDLRPHQDWVNGKWVSVSQTLRL